MGRPRTIVRALVVLAAIGASTLVATAASAGSTVTFPCVVQTTTTCLITIQLTSGMNEQIGSSMPDHAENWWNSLDAGSTGTGGYTLSGPGNPATSWNGNTNLLAGQVWSAHLSTGTESSGAYAALTFTVVPPKHYTSWSASYPSDAYTGTTVTVTFSVKPTPPAGHLLLQRHDAAWKNLAAFKYVPAHKDWTASFRWPYPKHTTKAYRVYATATPSLAATGFTPFHISTAP